MERRDKGKWTTKGEEQIAEEEGIEGHRLGVRKYEGAEEEETAANETADARAEIVENSANWKRSYIGPDRSNCEHEVKMDLDADVAIRRVEACVLVGALGLEDRFDGSITEDHTGREQAV